MYQNYLEIIDMSIQVPQKKKEKKKKEGNNAMGFAFAKSE